MKKIIFVRTAKYQYKQHGKSLYRSLDAIGLQTMQPHILRSSDDTQTRVSLLLAKYKPTQVFCSEFIRSRETAKLFSNSVTVAPQLNEIKFSMDDFSTPQELLDDGFDAKRINKIRYKFSCVLLNDSLREKHKSIVERITEFVSILRKIQPNTTVLCCSHGFIMKLYENFFRNEYKPYSFENIVRGHDWRKPPFGFLDGFVVEFDDSEEKLVKPLH